MTDPKFISLRVIVQAGDKECQVAQRIPHHDRHSAIDHLVKMAKNATRGAGLNERPGAAAAEDDGVVVEGEA